MTAFGKDASLEYVTCYNHTINLAVLEIVFPKKEKRKVAVVVDDDGDGSESDDDEAEIHVLEETFSSTIARMRAIINFFRRSTTKNYLLQEELAEQNLKKLELVAFTKTRWNSLAISGERFLYVLPAVLSVILSEELDHKYPWDDENTELLKVGFKHKPEYFIIIIFRFL